MYSVDGSMMIEGKVRESIYIVQTHTGATQRTIMAEESPLKCTWLKIVVAGRSGVANINQASGL